ncbi:MAG: hypothetical protein OXE50_08710 [Chloroflexi bacterium]|nr:hypothetical protein [Chloroflexota bacterium]
MTYDLTYISLGAGVQSSALYILAAQGKHGVPHADVAVFADTGDEPDYVYRQLERLEEWGKKHGGAPIHRVEEGSGSLSEVMGVRWVPIPAFTRVSEEKFTDAVGDPYTVFTLEQQAPDERTRGGRRRRDREGMLRRQCTKEFKVVPIQRFIKETVLGIPRGKPVKKRARGMMGFSCEEVARIKPSREKWIDSVYPLMDARLYRPHCIRIVEDAGLGTPRKSACTFCPYHSDRYWAEMKRDDPKAFDHSVDVDEMIRSAASRAQLYHSDGKAYASLRGPHPTIPGRSKDGIEADNIYVHRSCTPLKDVQFGDQPSLWGEECEGHCGI